MFSTAQNIARIRISLIPEGPFLIKSRDSLDPTRPDMEFVRLTTPLGETPYVPGSSLKGVVRSSMEALLRSLKTTPEICNPLDLRTGCVSRDKRDRLNLRRDQKVPLQNVCDVCKTFGNTETAGRVHIGDLLPWEITDTSDIRKERMEALRKSIVPRTSVAIDRRTGGSSGGALFEMETLCGGEFFGEVLIENYGLWQLGLLLLMFHRVDDGTLRLGFGKSRGLGRVRLTVKELVVKQYGELGVAPPQLRPAPLPTTNDAAIAAEHANATVSPLEMSLTWTGSALEAVVAALIEAAANRYGAR
jgi:CRISPR-associated protein Csm3